MSPVSDYKLFGTITDEEKELINILIDSALYRDMHTEDKQKLINYLVSSYLKTSNSTVGPFPR